MKVDKMAINKCDIINKEVVKLTKSASDAISDITNSRACMQKAVDAMMEGLSSGDFVEQECQVTHRFAPHCYLREIFMPKDAVVIGKIHRTKHFNIILSGEVTVVTPTSRERIKAPHTFISEAGVQKAVFVHEDCRWQTVHITDSTDLDEIEKEVIAKTYGDLIEDGLINKCIGEKQ